MVRTYAPEVHRGGWREDAGDTFSQDGPAYLDAHERGPTLHRRVGPRSIDGS